MNQPTPQTVGEYLEERAINQQSVFYGDLVAPFGMAPLTDNSAVTYCDELTEQKSGQNQVR